MPEDHRFIYLLFSAELGEISFLGKDLVFLDKLPLEKIYRTTNDVKRGTV